MQRMNRHTGRHGACGLGECCAEGIVAFIGNADPIHGAENDGLICTEKDNATTTQRHFIHTLHRIISHCRTE